ncbi:MAG: Fic family protein [Phycisphaerae bacterium]|nr:Fic family protein [Phycisphaerae bacterium]
MEPTDFHSNAAGRPIKTLTGYWAFVPAPLPPPIAYDADLVRLLSQADAALSELSGLGRYLPNPDLLIAPYVKREAVASSRIEGTQADLSDLLIDELEPAQTPVGSDVIEVRNYVAALHRGIRDLEKLPLSSRLVRDVHRVLMTDVRGQEKSPGEFRRTQNWIGAPGSTLTTASYVPPPPDPEMHQCIDNWERFMHERGTLPELIQCALLHEHFEAIHPFLDGNGRIGRLLITLFLIKRGRLSRPLLFLSHYIEARRAEYYTCLQRIRTHGDWLTWLRYFLIGVRDTSRSAIAQSRSILALRLSYQGHLHGELRALALLDTLFVNPYTTVARASEQLGVTAPTARKTIALLESAGMLEESTGKAWGRVWVAKPILRELETAPPASE